MMLRHRTMVDAVYEFQRDVRNTEAPKLPQQLRPQQHIDTTTFLSEELIEFAESTDAHGELDALIDIIYFAIGGMYQMGLGSDEVEACFNRVHEANMTKKAGTKPGRESVTTGDAVKPEGWKEPRFDDIFGRNE